MTKEDDYDPYAAIARIASASLAKDERALQVITCHLALEREVNLILATLTNREVRLNGFRNKARMLHALWDRRPDIENSANLMLQALERFDDLRNAVAHGNEGVEKCHDNLSAAYLLLEPDCPADADYGYIAQGLCAFIGDGMMPAELSRIVTMLDQALARWPNGK